MAVEIERKFLVCGSEWKAVAAQRCRMRQGYLNRPGRASVRVRIEERRALLNIKQAVIGAERLEYEYPIPLSDAEQMLASLCEGAVLDKTRYYLRVGAHLWEVDEFHGDNAGLVIAEIELAHVGEDFIRPPWLGQEVTAERRYYNAALAHHPYARWRAEERA